MKYLTLILLLLVGCGRDDKSKSENRDQRASSEAQQKTGSYYAATEGDMPTCDQKSIGVLVYVHQTNEFKSCQSGGYQTVSIKGKDGSNGQNGVNGKDAAQILGPNEWLDSENRKWYLGYSGNQLTANTSVCINSWRLPTTTEMRDACIRGIFQAWQAKFGTLPYNHAWASSNGDIVTTACAITNQGNGPPSTILCISK